MSDFTIEQLEDLKEGTTPGPWEASIRAFVENEVGLAAAAPELVDALIAEKQAHQKLRAEMEELVEYLGIQEGNDRPSRLYVHGQRSAMELIKDILEGE